ncbi:DUF1737 domain-containing protein [Methylobacterium platani]|uniref:DUF1737 domain-containing protein n=1 Tax=Methylobacterium indicum TaxID=1775910 RepID=A0ABR5GNX4_9HYPH|nr:hypothetical protein QR79_30910 [Methylobacterium indicum]KMO19422.1 hypothetical protein QR78_12635 [Methylobacterium indicum]
MDSKPPNDMPPYRLVTGKDDAHFCRRISEALALGYRLHGSPACTFNGTDVIVAQAVVWPSAIAADTREDAPPRA